MERKTNGEMLVDHERLVKERFVKRLFTCSVFWQVFSVVSWLSGAGYGILAMPAVLAFNIAFSVAGLATIAVAWLLWVSVDDAGSELERRDEGDGK